MKQIMIQKFPYNFLRNLYQNITKITLLSSLLFSLLFTVASCNKNIDNNNQSDLSANELYDDAMNHFNDKNYKAAATEFEKLFFNYPGEEITKRSELMQAYSLYLDKKYDLAYDVLTIFIELHPADKYIDYAHYLKAFVNFAQITSVDTDYVVLKESQKDFKILINKFPKSKYANAAKMHLTLIDNYIADHEIYVGLFYLNKENPVAAIKRFQKILTDYPHTQLVEEALFRLIESSHMLGLDNESQNYLAKLKTQYPESIWINKANRLIN